MSIVFGDPRLPVRLWSKVTVALPSGCWLWTAAAADGYGQVWFGGRQRLAHRLFYEHLAGTIPDGLQIDHLCRQRGCVNPAHLEPVTPAENLRRGVSGNALKTHCPRGHEYTHENTYLNARGRRRPPSGRLCRACRALAMLRFRAKASL